MQSAIAYDEQLAYLAAQAVPALLAIQDEL